MKRLSFPFLAAIVGCAATDHVGSATESALENTTAALLESGVGEPWISPDLRSAVYSTFDGRVVWRNLETGTTTAIAGTLQAVRPEGIVIDDGGLGFYDWQGRGTGARTPGALDGFAIAAGDVVTATCSNGVIEIHRKDDVVRTGAVGDGACAAVVQNGNVAAIKDGRIVTAAIAPGATPTLSEPIAAAKWLTSDLFEDVSGILYRAQGGSVTKLSNAPVPTQKVVTDGDAVLFLEGQPHGTTGTWNLKRWSDGKATTLATGTGRMANGGNYREIPSATSQWIDGHFVSTDPHLSILPNEILFDVVTTTYVVPRAGGEARALCDSCLVGLNGTDVVVFGKFDAGQTVENLHTGESTFVHASDPPGYLTSLFAAPDGSRTFRFWTQPENPNASTVYAFTIDSTTGGEVFTPHVAMSFDLTKARGDGVVMNVLDHRLLFRTPYGELYLL